MKRARQLLPLIAVLIAIGFGMILYPLASERIGAGDSADGHDRLGLSIAAGNGLAFYPSTEPTVLRGPIYPVLVAAAASIDEPGSLRQRVLLFQALLFGLLVWLTMRLVDLLVAAPVGSVASDADRSENPAPLLAGILVVCHPFLLWYSSRIIVETTSATLLALVVVMLLQTVREPERIGPRFGLGAAVGIAALCKAIFLVLIPMIPLLLVLLRFGDAIPSDQRQTHGLQRRAALTTLTVAILIVAPWSLRNWFVAERIVPVHILAGVNASVGDHYTENFATSPLAFGPIIDRFEYEEYLGGSFDMMTARAAETVDYDRMLLEASIERSVSDPVSFLRKVGIQLITFWGAGSSTTATMILAPIQLVLLVLGLFGSLRRGRQSWRSASMAPIYLVGVIWLAHVPLFAIGRFSIILVPLLAPYAAMEIDRMRRRLTHRRG